MVERIDRFDRWFVAAVDRLVRPLTTLIGRDGGAVAVALGLLGGITVTATIAHLVRVHDPGDPATLGLVAALLGAVTAFDVRSIATQVRSARRAAADGLLVTDPHQGRRMTWLALPALVGLSLPLAATVALALGSVALAAAYAVAGRCRPPRRRTRRRVTFGALSGAGA